MPNGILKTNLSALGDAVLTAVVAAIVVAAAALVSTTGFDVFTANWTIIIHSMVNIGVIAGVTTLAKNLLSNNNGSLLGVGPSSASTLG